MCSKPIKNRVQNSPFWALIRVGNGARVVALVVGVYDLTLPSELVFQLKNCYYVPAMSKNIISVSCLDVDGFHFIIKNNIFFIYNADIFMGMLIYLMVSTF